MNSSSFHRLFCRLTSLPTRAASCLGLVVLFLACPLQAAEAPLMPLTSPRPVAPPSSSATGTGIVAANTPGAFANVPQGTATTPGQVFGAHIFSGAFSQQQFSGFNPDYQIAVGDLIKLRMWGAFNLDATLTVDPQGNIFIPNVGPVNVLGVRNGDLNAHVESRIKRVYRANTGVYASLEAAQPVKVYVTGYVHKPGLYGGLSSDSILYYLDKAGGIDPGRGSFLDVAVHRHGKVRAQFNLYRFMLEGRIDPLQLQDGDTVVVGPRRHTVSVVGEVLNPYQFEFPRAAIPTAEVLFLAKPKANATHISIARKHGAARRGEYYALGETGSVMIEDGDEISITADKYPGTILIRIEGAHMGEHVLILPYGARLKDALSRIKAAPQANTGAAQLYRKSVAGRQKEMLEASLRSLETTALTARSATSEEAVLRGKEAELVMQFVQRAQGIQPRGQVLLSSGKEAGEALLEDGDTIHIPERSALVMVHGEVLFPNAIIHSQDMDAEDYIRQAGGYTQRADNSRIVVMHQDGRFSENTDAKPMPGDEIMVLPKVESKNIEITRGISQIIYQIAVAAKVVFGL